MRIVFVGAVDFSRHALRCVLESGGNVVGVVTLPPELSHRHSDYADLQGLAAEHGVPVQHVRRINDPETVGWVRSLLPDVIFVFGWSQLISAEFLEIPPLGCIGTHPALLPKNRGRHPLIWALVEGLSESGLTFFYLDDGADSGDILWQKPFAIDLDDDAGSLYEKIKWLGCEAIAEFLPLLEAGTAPKVQQDHKSATYWRKRSAEDGRIDWASTSMTTYNLVRALARPYPGADTSISGGPVKVWRMTPPSPDGGKAASGQPGTVLAAEGMNLTVRTGDGQVSVVEYDTEGALILVGDVLGG